MSSEQGLFAHREDTVTRARDTLSSTMRGIVTTPGLSGTWSIELNGYTIRFGDVRKDFTTWAEKAKETAARAHAAELTNIMYKIGMEAIRRCPHFSGALERAIRVRIPPADGYKNLHYNARLSYAVGVSSDWDSPYGTIIAGRAHTAHKYSGMHGGQLARFIHYYYNDFMSRLDPKKSRAWRRRSVKAAAANLPVDEVGSYFLTKAWDAGMQGASVALNRVLMQALTKFASHGRYVTGDDINTKLRAYAKRYDLVVTHTAKEWHNEE